MKQRETHRTATDEDSPPPHLAHAIAAHADAQTKAKARAKPVNGTLGDFSNPSFAEKR